VAKKPAGQVFDANGTFTDPPWSRASRYQVARKRYRRLRRSGREHRVNDAGFERGRRSDAAPGRDQIEGPFHTHEPRQPLGPEGAGKQPDLDLGKTELRAFGRDPPVARQGQFQSGPKDRAVQRGDYRTPQRLDPSEDAIEWRGGEIRLPEDSDIAARDEGAPGATDHQRACREILFENVDRLANPRNDRRGCGVNGRVVDA
jgi:hypothetical protein